MKLILIFCIALIFYGCVTVAPPPPFVTFGGPEITPEQTSEVALGVGTAATLFDGAHAGATGYFGRFKYGVSESFDLGVDVTGASRNDGQYLALDIGTRYQLSDISRLELAIGAGDDSDGKSLSTDFAYTIGTVGNKTWNYYLSLRFIYAQGIPGNALTLPGQTKSEESETPPNSVFGLISLGAQGNINENQKFIFEGGFGRVFTLGERSGPGFYLSAGILFYIGGK